VQIAFAVEVIHQRAAFVALIALVVATSIPLAFAWARILPEDAPPFKIEPGSFPLVDTEPSTPSAKRGRDAISLALLLCVTTAYLVRFPGMPVALPLHCLASTFSATLTTGIVTGIRFALLVGTSLAACIAAVRPGRMRAPLIAAAGLVLLLWLLGPILQSAMATA
jgi:hypothetical protein